jgi:hypothetical protein
MGKADDDDIPMRIFVLKMEKKGEVPGCYLEVVCGVASPFPLAVETCMR